MPYLSYGGSAITSTKGRREDIMTTSDIFPPAGDYRSIVIDLQAPSLYLRSSLTSSAPIFCATRCQLQSFVP